MRPHDEEGEVGMTYQNSRPTKITGVLAIAAFVSACTALSGPDAFDDDFLLDMAVIAADATLADFSTWSLAFAFQPRSAPDIAGAGIPGKPGGRHGPGHPLSGTRSAKFFDADGNEQAEYDSLTTERIEHESDVSGEVGRQGWTAQIARTRSITVTGLSGEETHRTRNGDGTEEVTKSRHTDEGTRAYHMTGEFTYNDVVVPIPGSDPRYPISGTVTRKVNASRTNGDETKTRSADITITFDGDETATIVVNGKEREIDLTAKRGKHPLKPRKNRGGG